jgi:hypothetical protein
MNNNNIPSYQSTSQTSSGKMSEETKQYLINIGLLVTAVIVGVYPYQKQRIQKNTADSSIR